MRRIRVLHSDCMEQSPWEANSFSASQEISRILWNSKVQYSFTSARHLFISWTRSIQSMIILPSTPGFSKLSLFLSVSQQYYMYTLSVLAAVDLRSALILFFWSLIQNITFVLSSHHCGYFYYSLHTQAFFWRLFSAVRSSHLQATTQEHNFYSDDGAILRAGNSRQKYVCKYLVCVIGNWIKNLHFCFRSLLHSISTHYVALQTRMRIVSHYFSYLW